MTPRVVRAPVRGGELVGWSRGAGAPVLLLHGGPGLSGDYLDQLPPELGDGFEVVGFQQRGVPPSTESGPIDIATQVADVGAVLDALGWERAWLVGHSWGGHLAVHVAAALPDRLEGVLSIDPLGMVGDGGEAAFEAELFARTPEDVRARAKELDERAMRGDGTADDILESMSLIWPAYFAEWDAAPPPPPPAFRANSTCYAETFDSLHEHLPRLEAALPSIRVPVGFVAGARSPMPVTASTDSAERIPGAWVEIVPGAGHFPWVESPGSVRAALLRLVAGR
jgi:pimeloyl-ACP methyl ester carboxylesterase